MTTIKDVIYLFCIVSYVQCLSCCCFLIGYLVLPPLANGKLSLAGVTKHTVDKTDGFLTQEGGQMQAKREEKTAG